MNINFLIVENILLALKEIHLKKNQKFIFTVSNNDWLFPNTNIVYISLPSALNYF